MLYKLQCETIGKGGDTKSLKPWKYDVVYDKLVIASGLRPRPLALMVSRNMQPFFVQCSTEIFARCYFST